MDFSLSDDRRMLKETLGRFLRERYPIEVRHAGAATADGFSRAMWREFAELGIVGALFPETVGGLGGDGFDIAVVFEELGSAIVVEPFASTLVAGSVLAAAGSDAQKALLAEVIAGEIILAFAHGEPESRYDLHYVETTAALSEDGWRLRGHKAVVRDAGAADQIVVSARTAGGIDDEGGITLFLIDRGVPGLSLRDYPTADGGHAAEVNLDGVLLPDTARICEVDAAYPVIEAAVGRGVLALSAEALGAMQTAREMTVAYLRERRQFGVPLGSFQALQHRMADIVIEIEQVRSAVINAAGRLGADRRTREWNLSAAKNLVGRVGRLVAEETIQMHGGIGVTWEYALPHFAKRLVMIDHMWGDTDHHLERVMLLSRAGAGAEPAEAADPAAPAELADPGTPAAAPSGGAR